MSPRRPYPKIIVLNREDAEAFVAEPTDVCISIASPRAPPARLPKAFGSVLSLAFDNLAGFTRPYPRGAIAPSAHDATTIAAFALHHHDATRMVIHCEAGISRSVTVALAISSKLSRRWAFPRWYSTEQRRTKHVRWRELFDAITAEIDRQRRVG